eukprot:gene25163-63851_t
MTSKAGLISLVAFAATAMHLPGMIFGIITVFKYGDFKIGDRDPEHPSFTHWENEIPEKFPTFDFPYIASPPPSDLYFTAYIASSFDTTTQSWQYLSNNHNSHTLALNTAWGTALLAVYSPWEQGLYGKRLARKMMPAAVRWEAA